MMTPATPATGKVQHPIQATVIRSWDRMTIIAWWDLAPDDQGILWFNLRTVKFGENNSGISSERLTRMTSGEFQRLCEMQPPKEISK